MDCFVVPQGGTPRNDKFEHALTMAVFELKAGVTPDTIEVLEEFLGEPEEQRLMVLEDNHSGRAWLDGYFESCGEGMAAWKRLTGVTPAGWSKLEPELRELPDADWKNSRKVYSRWG